ncbi:hypothetical protein [uncultured Solobacterium sp.]|uniref:hypothetical protein n=1 Tax=uncultured Solobacterium sp. TaxID=747375 RepID=UPI0028E3936F|nr:hypothetical protein [uncultured Solobacterium sp.]
MKNKTWLLIFSVVVLVCVVVISSLTVYVDPYMHYHKPLINKFYYELDNQRSQNNGIIKHFDYDAVITGTSMTETFKTSEMDEIFGCNAIKVPFSGASFKEINDNLELALKTHPNIKYVIRSLDRYGFLAGKNAMRDDLGDYPTYLYDNNPFNDIEYLLNRDVLYNRIYNMAVDAKYQGKVGITSFDEYSNWMKHYKFGKDAVLRALFEDREYKFYDAEQTETLSDEERETIRETVVQNITALADLYPNTQFYYFLPPYSAAYWGSLRQRGELKKQIEIEEYALSLIVSHKNIHLFGWNRFDITDNLNNYKDFTHYGEWVNSWMLYQMHQDIGRLDESNYQTYLKELYNHYMDFDYNSLITQTDNEDDFESARELEKEISNNR